MFWAELGPSSLLISSDQQPGGESSGSQTMGRGESSVPDRMSKPVVTSEDLAPEEFDTYWAISPSAFLRRQIPVNIGTQPSIRWSAGIFRFE